MSYEEKKQWILDYIVGEPNERHTEQELKTLYEREHPDECSEIGRILCELFAEDKIELVIKHDSATLYKAV